MTPLSNLPLTRYGHCNQLCNLSYRIRRNTEGTPSWKMSSPRRTFLRSPPCAPRPPRCPRPCSQTLTSTGSRFGGLVGAWLATMLAFIGIDLLAMGGARLTRMCSSHLLSPLLASACFRWIRCACACPLGHRRGLGGAAERLHARGATHAGQ